MSNGAPPRYGIMEHIDAGHHLEQLAPDMPDTPNAGGLHVYRAGVCLGVSDEFGNGFCRNRGVHDHDTRHTEYACYRCDVANEIETKVFIERGVERIRNIDR